MGEVCSSPPSDTEHVFDFVEPCGGGRDELPLAIESAGCGGRIFRRGWSGCVSVFVDESIAVG